MIALNDIHPSQLACYRQAGLSFNKHANLGGSFLPPYRKDQSPNGYKAIHGAATTPIVSKVAPEHLTSRFWHSDRSLIYSGALTKDVRLLHILQNGSHWVHGCTHPEAEQSSSMQNGSFHHSQPFLWFQGSCKRSFSSVSNYVLFSPILSVGKQVTVIGYVYNDAMIVLPEKRSANPARFLVD
jgi:hypothetical protein